MKLGNFSFDPRVGSSGYCLPYLSENVKQMTKNRIRLTGTNSGSAGLFGPRLGYGTYGLEWSGRTDGTDPNIVIAAWTYDDKTRDEIDWFEFGRWGDANEPNNLLIGVFDNEVRLPGDVRLPARAFNKWKSTMTIVPNQVTIKIEGWWAVNQAWKEVAAWSSKLADDFVIGQLRLAYWVKLNGFMYTASVDRGAPYVTLDNFTFVPYSVTADVAAK